MHINPQLVLRKEDKCFFNAEKFNIYKFNSSGFEMINQFQNREFTQKEFLDSAKNLAINLGDVQQFLEKCCKHDIFVS